MVRPEGRLVIVDFAPHALEFLREEHAHRHLGFADAEVADWCREAGLVSEPVRHLIGQPLTVSIWVGVARARGEGHRNARRRNIRARLRHESAACLVRILPAEDCRRRKRTLWQTITRLAPLGPRFVSVTYGAGGSTRERTHATVARIRRESRLEPAAHLTCAGASRAEIDAVARDYWDAGIRHIVALRGDPPAGGGKYMAHPAGYAAPVDLVAGLKRIADFEISVAAYPEVHPEAASAAADLDNLKRKLDAGATRAITQFFFEVDRYLRFRDRVAAAGITVPIVPGILPIANFAQAKKFAAACGASMPARLDAEFAAADEDPHARGRCPSVSRRRNAGASSKRVSKRCISTRSTVPNRSGAICASLGVGAPRCGACGVSDGAYSRCAVGTSVAVRWRDRHARSGAAAAAR